MNVRSTFLLTALLTSLPEARSYAAYSDRIPNGAHVPVPCTDSAARFTWLGVGHYNVTGSGSLNPFGQDFKAAGQSWTPGLCRADSDGDGKTNGEELGDPDCTWQGTAVPKFINNISHPGICEPLDGESCRMQAKGSGSEDVADVISSACARTAMSDDTLPPCDTLIPSADIQKMTFRLKPQLVSKKSEVRCENVLFNPISNNPATSDYHVIALAPLANISGVVARMMIFLCNGDKLGDTGDCDVMSDPSHCEMVGVWSRPLENECLHHNNGVRLVTGGLRSTSFTLLVQLEGWGEEADVAAEFGVTLFYSSSLRPHDAAIMVVGNDYVVIPPQSPTAVVTSDCTSTCTRSLLTGDVYITAVFAFMRHLSTGQEIAIFRHDTLAGYVNMTFTSADSARHVTLSKPLQVKPGDVIKTTCHYSSLGVRTSSMSSADNPGTQSESCRAYLRFYPAQQAASSRACVSWMSLLVCDPHTEAGCTAQERQKFAPEHVARAPFYSAITTSCPPFGHCTRECKDAIQEARDGQPCMANADSWFRVKVTSLASSSVGINLLASLAACDLDFYVDSQAAAAAAAARQRQQDAAARTQLLRRKLACSSSSNAQQPVAARCLAGGIVATLTLLARAGVWLAL